MHIAKGTIITVQTTNGGEITGPLHYDYNPHPAAPGTLGNLYIEDDRQGIITIYSHRIKQVRAHAA